MNTYQIDIYPLEKSRYKKIQVQKEGISETEIESTAWGIMQLFYLDIKTPYTISLLKDGFEFLIKKS